MFVLKDVGVGQNGTFISWIKLDIFFLCPVLSTYLFIGLLLFILGHLFLPSITKSHLRSDLQQESPGVGHQIDVSKFQEQPSTS